MKAKDTKNIEEIKVKEYKKLINFYKIIFEPSFREANKDDKTIYYI